MPSGDANDFFNLLRESGHFRRGGVEILYYVITDAKLSSIVVPPTIDLAIILQRAGVPVAQRDLFDRADKGDRYRNVIRKETRFSVAQASVHISSPAMNAAVEQNCAAVVAAGANALYVFEFLTRIALGRVDLNWGDGSAPDHDLGTGLVVG